MASARIPCETLRPEPVKVRAPKRSTTAERQSRRDALEAKAAKFGIFTDFIIDSVDLRMKIHEIYRILRIRKG